MTLQWPSPHSPSEGFSQAARMSAHCRLPKSPVPWGNWSSEVPKPWIGQRIGPYPPSHASGAFKPSLNTLSRPRLQKKNDWGLFSKRILPSTGLIGLNHCRRWTLHEDAEQRHLPLSLPTCPLTLSPLSLPACPLTEPSVAACLPSDSEPVTKMLNVIICKMMWRDYACVGVFVTFFFRLKEKVANIVKRIPVSLWSRFLECYIYHNHTTMIKI